MTVCWFSGREPSRSVQGSRHHLEGTIDFNAEASFFMEGNWAVTSFLRARFVDNSARCYVEITSADLLWTEDNLCHRFHAGLFAVADWEFVSNTSG